MVGVIGSVYSSTTRTIGMVTSRFNVPQISGSATSEELSDKHKFPFFMRTVLPDSKQGNIYVLTNYYLEFGGRG